MDVKRALEILEEDNPVEQPPIVNDLFEGMRLITELYDGDYVDAGASHDQIWYGSFEKTVAKMTEDQIRFMAKCGWFEAEDSWSTFV